MTHSLSNADLATLHKASFTLPRPWSETEFAGLLSMADVFLTCGDGPSFALGRVVVGEAELLTLAVDPSAQGRGLGRSALDAYEAEARRREAEVSFLEVAVTNSVAIKLYLSHGYSESGRRRAYYAAPDGTKIDAFVFSKPLDQA
jgi:ribosomal-protein-alanine N-acetyltransferase